MCVQNVPFKIAQDSFKRSLERELDFYEGLGLDVGFVPLCGTNRPLTVRCPMCGIVMDHTDDNYFCLECGIITRRDYLVQITLDDLCD